MSPRPVKLKMTGDSDVGLVRQINEDSFRLLPEHNAVIVCDGMGGHAAGEVASAQSVETVAAVLNQSDGSELQSLPLPKQEVFPTGAVALATALRLANRRVYRAAQAQRKMQGMGTTAVAMIFEPGITSVCHVGDSRAYKYAGQKLEPLTVDHSLVAELVARGEISEEQSKTFAERNIITRALGTHDRVAVDVSVFTAHPGDWYLLCSDGLCGYLDDNEIEQVLMSSGGNADKCVKELIAAANDRGGEDNCTVAIVEVIDPGESEDARANVKETVPGEADAELTAEDGWLDTVFAQSEEVRQQQAAQQEDTDRYRAGELPPAPEVDRDAANSVANAAPASESESKNDSGKKAGSPTEAGKKTGGNWSGKAGIIVLLAIIAVGVWYFIVPPLDEELPSSMKDAAAQQDEARLSFSAAKKLHDAVIYIADDSVGTAGEFLVQQIPLRASRFRIRAVWHDQTIFDSMVQFSPGDHILSLDSVSPN